MNVYQTDDNGYYVGIVTAQRDPLAVNSYLMPRGAYADAPPTAPDGKIARRDGDAWVLENIPAVDEPTPPLWSEMTAAEKAAKVNVERALRLEAGTTVTLSTSEAITLQGRDEDMRNLHGICTAAQLRLAGGDTTTETTFRDGTNTDFTLLPAQVIELWSLGSAWVSAGYAASWVIKDADPIPEDYDAESRWP